MKLNLGCGHRKVAGFVNVDKAPACDPDVVFDVEQLNWPWEPCSADEVLFNHSLEHMGAVTSVFLGIMRELYRVCAASARVSINAPHPRHDNFINDPTHVRVITPGMLSLFDLQKNREWIAGGFANTPLAVYTGVNFTIESCTVILTPEYDQKFLRGEINNESLQALMAERNNVAMEYRIVLRALK
jgi:hypothetical protein